MSVTLRWSRTDGYIISEIGCTAPFHTLGELLVKGDTCLQTLVGRFYDCTLLVVVRNTAAVTCILSTSVESQMMACHRSITEHEILPVGRSSVIVVVECLVTSQILIETEICLVHFVRSEHLLL